MRRGTASIELVLIATALYSMVVVAGTLWRIRVVHATVRQEAHHKAFTNTTDYSLKGAVWDAVLDKLDFLEPLIEGYNRVTGQGPKKVIPRMTPYQYPVDLDLESLPNAVTIGKSSMKTGGSGGVFERFGPYTYRATAATVSPPWTWHSYPWTTLESRPEADDVQEWYKNGLDRSIGAVRKPLRLAD